MYKTILIICVIGLLAALSVQGKSATAKCEQLNKNNPVLSAQCSTLEN